MSNIPKPQEDKYIDFVALLFVLFECLGHPGDFVTSRQWTRHEYNVSNLMFYGDTEFLKCKW